MAKGRIPKPQSIAVLKGDKRRKRQVEPTPPPGAPTIPPQVADDPVAKAEWSEITNILHGMGLLTRADKTMLMVYCETFARYRRAAEKVREYGEIILTPEKKYPQVSPYMAVLNRAQDQLTKLLVEMGLTPAARSRLAVERDDPTAKKWSGLVA